MRVLSGKIEKSSQGLRILGKLALVVVFCVVLRIATGGKDPAGKPAPLAESAGRFAMALTLPGAPWGGTDAGLNALRLTLPGGNTSAAPSPEPEPPADTPPTVTPEPEQTPPQPTVPPQEQPAPSEPQAPDNNTPPTEPDDGGDAVSTTITGAGGGYMSGADGLYYKNKTGYDLDIEELLKSPLGFSVGEGAEVLIIHSHSSEAYTPAGDDVYEPSDPWRTEDKTKSIIRVGDELEKVLRDHGVTVIHDRELYDYPSYTGSYTRSLEAVERYLSEDGNIKVVIDLHRDALEGSDGTVYKTVADIGDAPCAQVMIVCGTDYSGLEHPRWRENLSFALKIEAEMNLRYPTLARPLNITQYRYNQHTTTGSLIVEVGTNGNTLEEALNAVRYFGECLAGVLGAEA